MSTRIIVRRVPILALATLIALAGRGVAEEPWTFKGSVSFDRFANDDGSDAPGFILTLQPRLSVGVDASRSFKLDDNRRIDLSFGVAHERYPQNAAADRYFFNGRADYVVPLNLGALRQFRLGMALTHARDESDGVFNRARLEAAFRFQIAPRNTIQLRTRLGYRDQNDEHTFPGYDQSEFLLDLTHNWRTQDGVWRSTSMLYYEHRDAEKDIYTYDEVGVRLIGRRKLTEQASLVGRANTFHRDYAEGGREDQRLRGTLGVELTLEDKVTVEAFGGYQRNWSTIADKDYGGGVFGIQLSKEF